MFNKITPKIRVSYWFLSAFLKKHYIIVSLSFLISILSLLLLQSFSAVINPILFPHKERIAIIGEYTPSTLPLSIQSLISSGLTAISLEGSPAAGLSNSWDISPDGKIYTFYLKQGIKWHDNNEFNSSDINYNLNNAIIIPKSNFEVEVRLNAPYTPLPILLAKPLFKKGLIGVGPYKVKSLKLNGDRIEYLELIPLNKDLPVKTYRFYQTEDQAIIGFKLGEIDEIDEITDPKELRNWNNLEITDKVQLNRYVGLFFDTKNALFKDKDIRQILSLATPSLYGEKPIGSISPLSWAYYPKVKQYEQNLELAKKRISETVLASPSAAIKISTFQNLLPVASKISADWKSIGITSEIKLENSLPSDFEILLATQEIPPDPDQYPLWHSIQTNTNLTHLSNPKIDKLLEDGRITRDLDERLKIYIDFQRFIAEESPVAFLYYPRVYTVKRK